jgi:hypothetical protein
MARVALRSLFTAVVFGLLWIFTWPIYFDKEIRHGVSSEAGEIQIYTDTAQQKIFVRIDDRTQYLPTDKYEQSAFYQEATGRLRNAKLIDEEHWRLKWRALRVIIPLIVLLYMASGRLLEKFEEPPRRPVGQA